MPRRAKRFRQDSNRSAHAAFARRKLFDVHAATKSPIAQTALERIARLFAIEAEIRSQPPTARLAARQHHSLTELDALRAFLERELARISGKSTLAQAIHYAL